MQYVDFTIIVDTREQHPWELKHYTTASRKLDTGDYSVEGFENILCIERKYSISEFVNNMGEKRFKDVLERMQPYQYSFIIMEFNFNDILNFPIGSTIPKKVWDKLKISPSYIIKYITLTILFISLTYSFFFIIHTNEYLKKKLKIFD